MSERATAHWVTISFYIFHTEPDHKRKRTNVNGVYDMAAAERERERKRVYFRSFAT